MKSLFGYIRKSRHESNRVKLEKEKLVLENIHWSLNETRVAPSTSLFNNIPNEIILYIFKFLSIDDLCNVSLVCRLFKIIADDDEIWKTKNDPSIKLHSKSYKQIYIEWMHAKSLRNKELLRLRKYYLGKHASFACLPSRPLRSANKYQFELVDGFNQHPNLSQDMTIQLSVNIDETTPELIALLKKASGLQKQWQESTILKQMIERYYRFMQLKASHPSDILLIPTLDIEIVWQTHLLRPEIYRNDCLRLFHCIIDHSLIIKDDIEQFFREEAFLNTCQLYEQRFGEKYCSLPSIEEKNKTASNFLYGEYGLLNCKKSIYSYWDKTHFEFSSNSSKDYENPFSFTENDIIHDEKSFELCKEFMPNLIDKVSIDGPYFYSATEIDLSSQALKRLKKSYERFLYMAAKYPLKDANGFILRTYAIDIIWHSHMQEPLNYEADCLRLVGYIIHHNPSPNVEDEKWKTLCDVVEQIWKNEFQCDIETSSYESIGSEYIGE